MIRKYRIGKNPYGWFLSIPNWWGGYDVIDRLPSHEAAVWMLEHHIKRRMS